MCDAAQAYFSELIFYYSPIRLFLGLRAHQAYYNLSALYFLPMTLLINGFFLTSKMQR